MTPDRIETATKKKALASKPENIIYQNISEYIICRDFIPQGSS
jgi:hypothetical protein